MLSFTDLPLGGKNSFLLHRLRKHLQRHRRLIIRHLMPRPKNSQPAQIPHVLERPTRCPTDRIALHGFARERARPTILDAVGDGEATEPVTDPVGVAGPDQDLDAGLHDGGEGAEEGARIWRWLEG
jgi:hypothetical protein